MGSAISRLQFLRGDFRGDKTPVRPPWSVAEAIFTERCSRCGDCVDACPQHIITTSRGGFPTLDFSRGECLFCGDCVRRCETGAFNASSELPWQVTAYINDQCIARRRVECRTCGEQCEASAIRFRLQVGGPAQPELDITQCTGCGACFATCPSGAIEMRLPSNGGLNP